MEASWEVLSSLFMNEDENPNWEKEVSLEISCSNMRFADCS